ncbi:PAS domain-containing sensor histidine kinase [Halorubrum sp. Ib24]|uniref:PAS domain S-box protein n=1 Tax=unclassified Halorubrum TaxID=2642239 RepID=UPI000B97D4EF|nr:MULTISPECIES: PAS domain S-box protein [unclassified Halorubrum]OYR39813.1 PAS domain-containing sensor histidine kinase [Halorubrum sp. Ib24]OYR41021.1 PAS domain-containing sensor histidine kinase [Halorubrum sp. Eb13]OYR49736.1 PAS domain-containing sensor histidine kinase [Halorubrum sp. Ea8]
MTLRPSDRPSAPRGDSSRDDEGRPPTDRRRSTVDERVSPERAGAGDRETTDPTTAGDGGSDRFVAAVAVDGEVLFAGPSVPAVLGVEREALLGDNLLEHVHPNDRDPVSDALSAVAADRTVTHRLRHASGGFVWVESVVDEELAPEFGGRVVTARRVDIDRAFPERFRQFLEYGTDLVTVVDDDGLVRYESPSIEEVLGYEQGSTVGRSPLGYVHPDDRERVTERFYRALDDPEAAPTMEYRYGTADGDWVWLESRTRSLPDDVAVGRLLINSRDVSERKARERRLTDRNERLDRFASIVSHDLRNPLSVIRASMEMARLKEDTEPLERGERAVDRIDQLVSELLTLARQGSGIDEPTEFDLAGAVREAWATAGSDGATLVVGADARVRGDRGRLRQALENLFRNAVEHAREADADADVTVVVSATDEGIVVADDGPGIDPEHRRDAFEPGFTTSADGTGYGLDIVREVVESHGWSIELRPDAEPSLPAQVPRPDGACFVVEAPAPDAVAATEPWIDG